jgi:CHASE3 domain sensor protein
MLNHPSPVERVRARLDAGKRTIYRFRHGIIGPLALIWLTATVASVVMGTVAWSRFSRSIDASAEAEQLRESMYQLFSVLQDAEASERGYLLTGSAADHEAFKNADRTFPEKFERLAASARRDPAGQTDLSELRRLVDLELADLRQAIAQGQRWPPVLSKTGRRWTASVRSLNGGTTTGWIFCPPPARPPAAN